MRVEIPEVKDLEKKGFVLVRSFLSAEDLEVDDSSIEDASPPAASVAGQSSLSQDPPST